MSDGQHVEETKLREGSRLDLLYVVVFQVKLFQGGEAIKGLLQYQERSGAKVCGSIKKWNINDSTPIKYVLTWRRTSILL